MTGNRHSMRCLRCDLEKASCCLNGQNNHREKNLISIMVACNRTADDAKCASPTIPDSHKLLVWETFHFPWLTWSTAMSTSFAVTPSRLLYRFMVDIEFSLNFPHIPPRPHQPRRHSLHKLDVDDVATIRRRKPRFVVKAVRAGWNEDRTIISW